MLEKLRKMLGLDREYTPEIIVQTDVFRYKRNKLAANLALLGLFINCLYFMLFYALDFESYANPLLGFSVIVNLVVLLATFLASEGVKVYNKKYCIVLLVIAAIQLVRIFVYPLDIALGGNMFGSGSMTVRYFGAMLGNAQLATILIIYLVLSMACILASALVGYVKAVQLDKFNKDLSSGIVSVEDALAELDAKDAAAATVAEAAVAAEEV